MPEKVLCITAFKDIGRTNWANFTRSTEEYLNYFDNLSKAPLELVCFCDEPIASIIKEKTGFTNIHPYKKEDTFYKYFEEETRIINDSNYKSMLAHRLFHPQHSFPDYNIVNHNKFSFVRRASELFPDYTHYVWIDFGYFRTANDIPHRINWGPVLDDKIHYTIRSDSLLSNIPSIVDNCIQAPEIIAGSIFIVPKYLVSWLECAYKEILTTQFYENNLTDFDQAVILYVYKKYSDKFQLHLLQKWFGLFDELLK